MLWEVEIVPIGRDGERETKCDEFDLLTHSRRGCELVVSSARGYLLQGSLGRGDVDWLAGELFIDALVEKGSVGEPGHAAGADAWTVLLKPGVTDPAAQSVLAVAQDRNIKLDAVRTFRRYRVTPAASGPDGDLLARRVLANEAIEEMHQGGFVMETLALGRDYSFRAVSVPILEAGDDGLLKISRDGQLALSLAEMRTIQAHFAAEGREPSDVELETIAQTWSEHCSHKTLKGRVDYTESGKSRTYANLLKETIFGATVEVRRLLGESDFCVSVFSDNAGVVKFDENFHVCFKVETHNHPSAIEPYGGANTGLGGVIRDPLGTGLGAKPIANTDVFCFAPPDFPPEKLPKGVLHPRRVMTGVVSGVRDYGNRMGIPTVNGAVVFDERYLGNPLVYCGTVGLIPVGKIEKAARPGDLIVAAGGRTGRDGIHGATFSSLELHSESETASGGAVQIGNAITQKQLMEVVLQARDLGLYSAITDCGAGGFSSAVGEMGAELGARVELDKAPLKYRGLSYTEIWISESQERMVMAVPPANWERLRQLFAAEGVEAAALGTFEATGRLQLFFGGSKVGDLPMRLLHDGLPPVTRKAEWTPDPARPFTGPKLAASEALMKILATPTVASKEWIIRQYDHEVQGGTIIKPLVGEHEDGPGNASVITPVLGSCRGVAVGCGINPRYGDLDPYAMAACAVDEALRNVVAVGADPAQTSVLDNFCWGDVSDPAIFGTLVRSAEGCRDAAVAFRTPFISGKDSLYNTFRDETGAKSSIPGTMLVSAIGIVPDVRRCQTMDIKKPGNTVIVIGVTGDHLGGSHYGLVCGAEGGSVPTPDLTTAPKVFAAVHRALSAGLLRACHDPSEGGLAVAFAEMAFAGGVGLDVTGLGDLPTSGEFDDTVKLFSESPTRFVAEVEPAKLPELATVLDGLPWAEIGVTVAERRLRIAGDGGEWLVWAKLADLKEAWQQPLRME